MGIFGPKAPAESIYGNAILHRSISSGPAHGSAVYQAEGCTSVPLGIDPRSPDHVLFWNLTSERGHGLCFSATGGGKNTNLIQPALLTYKGSALVLDPKAESAWICGERRRAFGRVVILDPWNKVNETYGSKVGVTEATSKFNPLARLDPRSRQFNDDIALIADAVIFTPPGADPHWADSARDLVSGLIAASVERAPGVASFRDVRELLTGTDDALAIQVKRIVESNPDSLAARKLRRFVPPMLVGRDGKPIVDEDGNPRVGKPNREISSIRSGAETQTSIFDAADLLDAMDTGPDAFDLADLARERVTVFVVLPAERLATHGRWMRLIIQLAMVAIAGVPTPPPVPVLFLLDELGTINPGGGLRMVEQAYGLMGSMGIRVWGFFQSLDQLQRDYPATWKTFIANAETIQLLRINDHDTAEYFSRHIGNATWARAPGGQWKPSRDGKIKVRTNVTWNGTQPVASREEGQIMSRPAILPQELMRLGKGEVVSLFAGRDGFRLPSLPYFKEPRLAGRYRHNPLYPAPVVAPPPPPPPPLISPEMKAKAAELAGKAAAVSADAATRAAAWARTDGAAHAREAAAVASAAASAAAGKLSGWWKSRKGSSSSGNPPEAAE